MVRTWEWKGVWTGGHCSLLSASPLPGWTVKTKTNFSKLSPIYLFGHVYCFEVEGE